MSTLKDVGCQHVYYCMFQIGAHATVKGRLHHRTTEQGKVVSQLDDGRSETKNRSIL